MSRRRARLVVEDPLEPELSIAIAIAIGIAIEN